MMSSRRPGRGGPRRPPASPFAVLAVTTLGLFVVVLNANSVSIALPSMSAAFAVDPTTANWFLIAFMLTQTSSILVFGRTSDLLGRKRVYLAGMASFVLLSALIPFAPNAAVVITLRALQGVAAATTVVNTTAIIAHAFPAARLAMGLSLNLTAAAVAQTVSPAVGGALIGAFGWQAVFFVSVPFGVLAIALGAKLVSGEREFPTVPERFDWAGAVLSAAGLGCLLYGVNESGSSGGAGADGAASIAVLTIGVGLALIAAFVAVELRVAHPLVDLTLVRDRGRACAFGAAFFTSFALAGTTVLVALHLQVVSGYSAVEAGFVVMVLAVAMMAASLLSGRLGRRFPVRVLSSAGGLLLLLGLVLLLLVLSGGALPPLAAALAVIGFGVGFFTTPNTTSIMKGVPSNRLAIANAIRSMFFNSAQAVGTAVCLLLVAASGITSYAGGGGGVLADPGIEEGFAWALIVLVGSAALALALALLRGGPWSLSDAR